MVLGFFTSTAPTSSHSTGATSSPEHGRHQQLDASLVSSADVHATVVDQKAASSSFNAPVASDYAPSRGAGNGQHHPVLSNGHAIRHLAVLRGYAAGPDGVRLFYEIFESHRKPSTSSYLKNSACCYEVTVRAARDAPERVMAEAGPAEAIQSILVAARTHGSVGSTAGTALPIEDGGAIAPRQQCGFSTAAGEKASSMATEAVGLEAVGTPAATREEIAEKATATEVANVLLIMGFAAGRHGWLPLIQHWMEQAESESLHRVHARFCVFDNRGIGDSDSPQHSSSYSTTLMARDALAVMDHLGWRRAHVVGFSMGGMIALRLAVEAPQRLLSLTVLSVTNGGWQLIPTRWRAFKLLLWAATARTPRQRAHADVHFHFSRDTLHTEVIAPKSIEGLNADVGGSGIDSPAVQVQRVEAVLINEYVSTSRECTPQPHAGLMGQLRAVWTHGLSISEQHSLRRLDVPFKVIHGYHDTMAMPAYGERIARHARAPFIMLNGGHFVVRECASEVCMHISDSIATAEKLK
ncbi:hypothetical protein Vretimale_11375 [Volvox reticuliferus]|uniref:AB hydrolase-1 domain-containing protein n=1 Tax=Volvox reticuliferus TaxID=1737510 RepID=A0A8J4CK35_9CHLO|nr:hypothetical protein Vretifemale_12099 [Volvox reticuliferus]GIM07166.1 hypothetical protein Vretimale_11375 [Volvox reticuliferus]